MILFVDDNAGILFIKSEIVADIQVVPKSGSRSEQHYDIDNGFNYKEYRRKKDEEELLIIIKIAVQWLR